MKMKKKKKIMAILLAVALIGTYGFSASVFALDGEATDAVKTGAPIHIGSTGYDTLQGAVDAAEPGNTITIDSDYNTDQSVILKKSVILKLNANLTIKGNREGYLAGIWAKDNLDLTVTSENGSRLFVTGFYEGLSSSNTFIRSSSFAREYCSLNFKLEGNAVADFSNNVKSGMFISPGPSGSSVYVGPDAELIANDNEQFGCELVYEGKTDIDIKGKASFNRNREGINHMFNDGTGDIRINVTGGTLNLCDNTNTGIDTAHFGVITASEGGTINISGNRNTGSQNSTLVVGNEGTVNVNNNESWGIWFCDVTAESGGTLNAKGNKGGVGDYVQPSSKKKAMVFTAKAGSKVMISGNTFGFYMDNIGGEVNVEDGADFTVRENRSIGIFSKGEKNKINLMGGKITDNNCSIEGWYGAGISNFYGDVVIGGTCRVWNNSTTGYGDDIANFKGTVTLRDQSSDNLTLKDGSRITGWYYDGMKNNSETKRWSAEDYYEEVTGGKLEATGATGIKAAHGKPAVIPPYTPPGKVDPPAVIDPQPEPDPGEGEITEEPEQGETETPKKPRVIPGSHEGDNTFSSKTEKAENKESDRPQTGDNSMTALYAVIALSAAGTMVGLVLKRRKEQ